MALPDSKLKPDDSFKSNCIFCKIAYHQDQENKTTYFQTGDSDFVSFKDIRPAGKHHYLIIPKKHIRSLNSLNRSDIALVEKMREIGLKILREEGADMSDILVGFHWPIYTVGHLHLHAISPTNQMTMIHKIEFSKYLFGSVQKAIETLSTRGE